MHVHSYHTVLKDELLVRILYRSDHVAPSEEILAMKDTEEDNNEVQNDSGDRMVGTLRGQSEKGRNPRRMPPGEILFTYHFCKDRGYLDNLQIRTHQWRMSRGLWDYLV